MKGKKVFIDTLGCEVNRYEAQAQREMLLKAGCTFTEDVKEAEYYILNTCIITEAAEKECALLVEKAKRINSSLKVVAVGCLAETSRRHSGVDHFVPNSDKAKLVPVVFGEEQPFEKLAVSEISGKEPVIVKIVDGCEKFCSFCVDPYVRGKVKSRDIKEIFEEITRLAGKGAKEIVLAGVNIGCYGEDLDSGLNLASVLSVAAGALKVSSVRIGSIEPEYVTDELLDVMEDSIYVKKHLHIPLQSGDDTILRLMNRKYTTAEYRKIIGRARSRIKGLKITTDIIVGFPNETEENFEMTLAFVEELDFSGVEVFTYSDRPGTKAFGFEDKVKESVKRQRYEALKAMVSR